MEDGRASNNTVANYFEAIDREDDELASLRGSYMANCKGPRGRIRDIKGEAKEAGTNMRAFNTLLKKHRADRAQAKRVADLEAEDAADYEQMAEALGDYADTPLGSAALDKAKGRNPKRSKEGSLDSLRAG